MSGYDSELSNTDSDNDSDSETETLQTKKPSGPLFKIASSIKGVKEHVDEEIDDADEDDETVSDDSEEEINLEDDEEDVDRKVGGDTSDEESDDDDDDEEDSEAEVDENGELIEKVPLIKTNQKTKRIPLAPQPYDDDDEDDDEYEENYLQKFDNEIIKNYVNDFHPECLNHNYDEIAKMSIVVRNSDGIIIDPLHKTIPYLTKYEKARILGQRSKQIETGAKPLVKVPENIVDGYIIAELELKEKKIPFIIRRPIPGGSCEYWHLRDLENIGF
jgi:DNA-directed RNA polymerase I, II, and III subunit RPABC2